MREKVRSPPPRRGSNYSPDYWQDRQYPPRHDREFSPSHRRSPDNQRNHRYSPPHVLRDRDSRFGHGLSSRYGEMERPRQGASGAGGIRGTRDYGRDLDGDREKQLVELTLYNEDPRGRDDHFNQLKRVNMDAKLGSEYPIHSMVERDYPSRMDEDRDRHSLKMLDPRDDIPQRDSQYAVFHGKRKEIASYSSYSSKYFLEYGGSGVGIKGHRDRYYQNGGIEGLESSRMMLEKSTYPSEDITFSTHTSQSGNKRSYQDHGDEDIYSQFKKFNGGHSKDDESRPHSDLSRKEEYVDGPQSYTKGEIPRFYSEVETTNLCTGEEENPRFYSRDEKPESYSREGKPQLYSGEEKSYLSYRGRQSQYSLNDALHHDIPLTKYKASATDPFASSMNDLRRSYKDHLVVGSDGYGYVTNPLPTENSKFIVEEAISYRKDKHNTNVGTRIDYSYSAARGSDYTEMVSLSDKSYGKLSADKDDSRYIDSLGARNRDSSLAGTGSRREHLTEERLRDDHSSPIERIVSSYLVSKASFGIGSNVEGLGDREMDLGYEAGVYRGHENKDLKEDHGYGRDEGLQRHIEKNSCYLRDDYRYGRDAAGLQDRREYSLVSKNYDHNFNRVNQVFGGDYCDPLEGVKAVDMGMFTQSKDVSERRRDISERLSINRDVFEKASCEFTSNKSTLRGPMDRNPWVSNDIVQSKKFEVLESEGSSVGKAQILNPVDRHFILRRGPARPVERIIVKTSVNVPKKRKGLRKNKDGNGNGSVQAEEGGPSEHVKMKSEPPEKSDEFKQLVRNAFFKFVKQLNEDAVELKKFKEQGKVGCLKCWVCGSNSGEFWYTESLVKHACSSTRLGSRSQHLGFHKALCALMGWKAADIHYDKWIREVLSVAEIASLKKDLILWPPLVIVHNSSIEKSNPGGQVAVSVEDLETMIKDMGFEEKAKVHRGKPVNHSIMVVKFSATYSGFQEAERLHKFFAGKKHGRIEFLKIKSKGHIISDDRPKASADNTQDVLYGFLGTSRDLNKLESETKKQCVVRSKKQIQDLGDATIES